MITHKTPPTVLETVQIQGVAWRDDKVYLPDALQQTAITASGRDCTMFDGIFVYTRPSEDGGYGIVPEQDKPVKIEKRIFLLHTNN